MSAGLHMQERPKLRKQERRKQILLELQFRPHVRIADMADHFRVSTETIRRDLETLSGDGLLDRAHGGASALSPGRYPGFDERATSQVAERERIGQLAAALVESDETLMVDSGATTLQFARALARIGTSCTVLTNSLPVAMVLGQGAGGQGAGATVILCPGDYLASESATIGPDTVEFLEKHFVHRCFIGASALSEGGASEEVRGFAAVKRAMLDRSARSHLLIGSEKFGRHSLTRVCDLARLDAVVCDRAPQDELAESLQRASVEVHVA